MNTSLEVTRTSRKMLSQFLKGYSLAQLNSIPEGHNNNLIWNIAHVVVVQQMLVYNLSGLPMNISATLVQKYKKGTKPEQDATQAEVDEIYSLLVETIDQTEVDLNNNVFVNYQEYPTSTGLVLKNVKDAMSFNNFHEGIHIGAILSLRKFV
ncbi:DinB family protein [Flavobacterium degerlachei]|uniref:DinB superfamily protein n=1 Tax=Flavobacterium degerlachei TaxID=229203 RepID=A0A1H2RG28_9FLAO|nr:DinB family protein [Flavobacterium degerlachei]SDW18120.1 DinB superfamily protein [Flavobacterium degerlachei]